MWLAAQPLAAQASVRPEPDHGLSPAYFWFTSSAALLSAGIGGLYAIRVSALYSQSKTVPDVAPTQLSLKHKAETYQVNADCLFASAAAFGIASVWLALLTQWPSAVGIEDHAVQSHTLQFRPLATQNGAGVQLMGWLP